MPKTRYEQRSTLDALEEFLDDRNYTGVTYTDGYQPEGAITPPQVTVTFPPSSPKTLQLGRVQGQESLYQRTIVVNAYMENEGRASSIIDDIMDFLEFTCIEIKDHQGNFLGNLICSDTEGILGQVFPPIMANPQSQRWRAAVSAPFEAFYPNS